MKPQRVRVQRLLEQRPRESSVAEALAAARAVEDLPERALGTLAEGVLALGDEPARDRDELLGSCSRGKSIFARSASARWGFALEEVVHKARVAGDDD